MNKLTGRLAICLALCLAGGVRAQTDGPWIQQVRAACEKLPSRPRRAMLVFPLVDADSADGTVGKGQGLIAAQAMWLSSFAEERLLDTYDYAVIWRLAEQQLLGPGRKVTDAKVDAVRAVMDIEDYVVGTLRVTEEAFEARLQFQGRYGAQTKKYSGARDELHVLPCRIARDVLAYQQVELNEKQARQVDQPPLSSTDTFEAAAQRYHALWYFTSTNSPFWRAVAEECRTPWTEYMYLLSAYYEDSWGHRNCFEEFGPQNGGVPFEALKAEMLFTLADERGGDFAEAGRAAGALLERDPYAPHLMRWTARSLGAVGEEELAEQVLDRLVRVHGGSIVGRLHRGLCLIPYAWDARGGGWASTVTREGWAAFDERLRRARDDLEAVLQREPRCYLAARRLLVVAKGLCLPRQYCDEMFMRAIAACPTARGAYGDMLGCLLPRWGGTRQELLDFGRACARTGLHEAGIPMYLIHAHWDTPDYEAARRDADGPARIAFIEDYFKRPDVWAEVRPVLEQQVTRCPEDHTALTLYMVFAFWNGETELTSRLYQAAQQTYRDRTWTAFRKRRGCLDLTPVRDEIRWFVEADWPPLPTAVRCGGIEQVRALLAEGADPAEPLAGGWTALHLAAARGEGAVCSLLLEHGASAAAETEDGATALHIAAERDNAPLAQILIDAAAPLEALDKEGQTPALVAARKGNPSVLKALLRAGAALDAVDAKGRSMPLLAANSGSAEAVRILALAGADLDAAGEHGRTALHVAALWGRPKAVKALLAAGASPNVVDKQNRTPLNHAITAGSAKAVAALLEAGADPHGDEAVPCLYSAVHSGRADLASLLLEAGADPNAAHGGYTCLRIAAYAGDGILARLLLDAGADPDMASSDGYSALHTAASRGHPKLVRIILDAGADASRLDPKGRTALDLAIEYGHPSVQEVLRSPEPQGDRRTLKGPGGGA